jgi:hypothetical protein
LIIQLDGLWACHLPNLLICWLFNYLVRPVGSHCTTPKNKRQVIRVYCLSGFLVNWSGSWICLVKFMLCYVKDGFKISKWSVCVMQNFRCLPTVQSSCFNDEMD